MMKLQKLIDAIKKEAELKEIYIIAIDGMAASGKTTLGCYLQKELEANLIHMDDFFLPTELRNQKRLSTPGGNIHYERFYQEIISSLKKNIHYHPFDCHTMQYKQEKILPFKKIVIIEGVYALHPFFKKYYDYAIFLKVSNTTQYERLKVRNQNKLEQFVTQWIPLENQYFETFQIESLCNKVIMNE